MKNNNWKEKEPVPCEICKCCETDCYYNSVTCHKYNKTYTDWIDFINHISYDKLYKGCKCHKNYPSFFKKLYFRFMCFIQYLEDIKYHRFDD